MSDAQNSVLFQASIYKIPLFETYEWKNCSGPDLSNTSDINKINISMAIQLAGHWLLNYYHKLENPADIRENNDGLIYTMNEKFLNGIQASDSSGRFHKIDKFGVR